MTRPLRVLSAIGVGVWVSGWAPSAAGQDGLYGRLDSDLTVSAGVGAGAVWGGRADWGVVGELRARYLGTAGIAITPEFRPEDSSRLTLAVELRPLFPLRFLVNAFSTSEFFDLLVESVGVELGVAVGPLSEGVGVGFVAGGGFELPLVLPSVWGHGLFLRLAARYTHARPEDDRAPRQDFQDWTTLGVLTVPFQFPTGLAEWEPVRYRAP